MVRAASEFRRAHIFRVSFHTIVTLRASYYAPPDTGVSDLQLVALERLPSIEGVGQICWSAPFRGEFFICTHPMPSPMRGRWHGEAVTDEVGQFCLRGTVHLISRLRRQLPLIGEAIGGTKNRTASIACGSGKGIAELLSRRRRAGSRLRWRSR